MNYISGFFSVVIIFIIYVLLFLHTFISSANISFKKCDYKNKFSYYIFLTVFINILYGFVFVFLHKILLHRWNFIHTFADIFKFDISNQHLTFFGCFFMLSFFISVFIGFLLRKLNSLLFKNNYCFSNIEKQKKPFLMFFSVIICASIILLFNLSFTRLNNIFINEICSFNSTVILDEPNYIYDYIELYNDNFFDCSLNNVYISDNEADLHKKQLPYIIIPAKSYLVIKLDDAKLSISENGNETIILSDSSGSVIDKVKTVPVPADYSYCRSNESSDTWVILSCTPNQSNTYGFNYVSPPDFSHKSGFYSDEFQLTITAPAEYTIYYTTDGTTPTSASHIYTEPIRIYNKSSEPNKYTNIQNTVLNWKNSNSNHSPVDKAFVIRAVAVDNNGISSEITTASYFVDLEKYSDKNVISLVVNPDDFWGENGIYVTGKEYDDIYLAEGSAPSDIANFNRHGREYESRVSLTYLSPDLSFTQNAGIRISGASTRNYAKKRFALYSRDLYSGSSVFNYDFFDNTYSHKLYLRDGYANCLLQDLIRDRHISSQYYKPVSVFLNGEFWYDTFLMEAYDSQYFNEHYNVDKNNTLVYKGSEISEGTDTDNMLFNQIFSYVENHDMSNSENYAEFGEIIDLQSYIDFICFNAYIANVDVSEKHNLIYWRSQNITNRPYEDGKWRFGLHDLDEFDWGSAKSYSVSHNYEKNKFDSGSPFSIKNYTIFNRLADNPEFRKQFTNTFMDMINENFRYENVQKYLDYYSQNNIASESLIDSYSDFFKNRPTHAIRQMAEFMNLSGTAETITVYNISQQSGYIQVNTITPDISSGCWSGQYFTDFPVTVTAVPNPGYAFVGWTGDIQSESISIDVPIKKGGVTINAIFQKAI